MPLECGAAIPPLEAIPLNNDLQKASLLKRISAYLVDLMALVCVISAVAFSLSAVLGYDDYSTQMDAIYEKYEKLGLIEITEELTEEQIAAYNAAVELFNNDEHARYVYGKVIDLSLIISSVSILVGYVVLEFLVPLWLKNGQTFGKKIFGIGLMRMDCVQVTPFMMFARGVLGKGVVETLIPALLLIMMFLGASIGATALLIIGLLLLAQVILLFATRNHSALHDMLACTIAVDLASQRIFDSPEARIEHIKRISAENAAKAKY